jgi:hypothetical protein
MHIHILIITLYYSFSAEKSVAISSVLVSRQHVFAFLPL